MQQTRSAECSLHSRVPLRQWRHGMQGPSSITQYITCVQCAVCHTLARCQSLSTRPSSNTISGNPMQSAYHAVVMRRNYTAKLPATTCPQNKMQLHARLVHCSQTKAARSMVHRQLPVVTAALLCCTYHVVHGRTTVQWPAMPLCAWHTLCTGQSPQFTTGNILQ